MENFDPKLFQSTIDSLQINNLKIKLISKTLENECDLTEKIYGTKY